VGGAGQAAGELTGGGVEVVAGGEPFLPGDLPFGPRGGEFVAAGLDRPQLPGGVVCIGAAADGGDERRDELGAVEGGEDAVADFVVGQVGGDGDGAAAVLAQVFDAQVPDRREPDRLVIASICGPPGRQPSMKPW
jgi:hypothetical protein